LKIATLSLDFQGRTVECKFKGELQLHLLRTVMKKLVLGLGLIALAFCLGCGDNGNNNGGGPVPIGNFSNASLNGQFAYQLVGVDTVDNFREAGVLVADGSGNITSGVDDFSQGSSVFSDQSSGSYSISNDGTGTATLNFSGGGFITFALTLVSSSKFYMIVTSASNVQSSTVASGAGVGEKQDTSVFSAPPNGTFVFRQHTISSAQGASSNVGVFTSGGGILTGSEDLNHGGSFSTLTLTGLLNSPDGFGRASGTMTDSNNVTSTFVYYIVNANNIRFFSTDAGSPGLGRAEMQTAAVYSNTSLNGNYVFGGNGDTLANFGSSRAVGAFTADGAGTLSAGAYDAVVDGTTSTNIAFSGSYSMASDGRAVLNTTPVAGATTQVFWMVSPSRAFYLLDDPNRIEDGTVDLQTTSSFSNGTMNGQFGLVMHGYVLGADTFDRVGTLQWDGNGTLTLNEAINLSGTVSSSGFITGTYSVGSNGRATGSISGLSNNLVFYLISGTDGYVLQNDTSTEIDGIMSKQQ